MTQKRWSAWRPFPDPNNGGMLRAPLGAGCYELREGKSLVLYGMSSSVAQRMSSLLGGGARKNVKKQDYVRSNLAKIEYRTIACRTQEDARRIERELKQRGGYRFPT